MPEPMTGVPFRYSPRNGILEKSNASRPQPQNRASTLRMMRYVCGRMYGQTDLPARCLATCAPLAVTLNVCRRRRNMARRVALICVQKLAIENSSELTIDPNPFDTTLIAISEMNR